MYNKIVNKYRALLQPALKFITDNENSWRVDVNDESLFDVIWLVKFKIV